MRNEVYGPLPERYQEYAGLIHEGGRNLTLVVDDVLDLARIESGKFDILPEIAQPDGPCRRRGSVHVGRSRPPEHRAGKHGAGRCRSAGRRQGGAPDRAQPDFQRSQIHALGRARRSRGDGSSRWARCSPFPTRAKASARRISRTFLRPSCKARPASATRAARALDCRSCAPLQTCMAGGSTSKAASEAERLSRCSFLKRRETGTQGTDGSRRTKGRVSRRAMTRGHDGSRAMRDCEGGTIHAGRARFVSCCVISTIAPDTVKTGQEGGGPEGRP